VAGPSHEPVRALLGEDDAAAVGGDRRLRRERRELGLRSLSRAGERDRARKLRGGDGDGEQAAGHR
jgi:hypothetical protein